MDQNTKSETLTVSDFFKDSNFMIPEIQRNFTWTANEQVNKLFTDLTKFYDVDHNIVPQYFLGTCILYEGSEFNGSMQIMDGQQRITSLVTLFSAIKSLLENRTRFLTGDNKSRFEDHIEQISEKILFSDEEFKHCRIKPKAELDHIIVDNMTKLDGKSLLDSSDTSKSSDKKLSQQPLALAFNYFHRHLLNFAKKHDEEDPWQILINFSTMIKSQILLTKTITKTLPMAFQMFVSVNGAGKALISYDVLRGLVIAMAHTLEIQKEVNEMLRALNKEIKQLRDTQTKETAADAKVTDCLLYWLESRKGKNIQQSQVIDIIEHDLREYSKIEQFQELLSQFESFARWYRILNHTDTKYAFARLDSYTRNRILRLTGPNGGWKAKHIGVLVTLHMNKCGQKEITKVMQLIEWVEFRTYSTQISNHLEKVLPAMAKAILNGKSIDLWGPGVVENIIIFMKRKGSGFQNLNEYRLNQNEARAFLHKITASEKDITATDLVAAQLMPEGSPAPWNSKAEKEDNGSVSLLLGNWFLVSGKNQKEISQWNQNNQLTRVKMVQKYSIGGDAKSEISILVEQISRNQNSFSAGSIESRTRQLIRQLELLFPENGPRYILSPPK
jgi:hypothetical protein